MTEPTQAVQEQPKDNSKEFNFRQLEAKFERQLAQERAARLEAERLAQEAMQKKASVSDDDDEDSPDPYIDRRQLKKTLSRFGEQTKQETQTSVQREVQKALQEERRNNWMKQNPDFIGTLTQYAEEFAQREPELADAVLKIPDEFERQKAVYKNIKALGLDKPAPKQPSIQEKIDANRRSPYYQPSGIANAPYSVAGDFSESGQKNAYQKMQELKKNLRI